MAKEPTIDFGPDVCNDAHLGGMKKVIAQMLGCIRKITSKAYTLLLSKWQLVLEEIERLSEERERLEKYAHKPSTHHQYDIKPSLGDCYSASKLN